LAAAARQDPSGRIGDDSLGIGHGRLGEHDRLADRRAPTADCAPHAGGRVESAVVRAGDRRFDRPGGAVPQPTKVNWDSACHHFYRGRGGARRRYDRVASCLLVFSRALSYSGAGRLSNVPAQRVAAAARTRTHRIHGGYDQVDATVAHARSGDDVRLGIPERTEIEWFVGPHAIHGVATFDFLHRRLKWPAP